MPINFMPPGPVAPGLAAAGGAAEAQMRDFPTLASFYSHMASLRAGAEAQAGAANAQRMQQDRQFAWNAGEQQQEFAAGLSQQQSATSEHAAATEASLQNALMQQQQHAALDVWASGQKLSQADRMQEQERQNGLARLRKAKDDGQIDAGTYYDGVASLMTGINQFGARQKREEMEAQTAHLNQQTELIKGQTVAQNQAQALRDATIAERWKFVPDPSELPALRQELFDAGQGPRSFDPAGQQEFESRVTALAAERKLGARWAVDEKGGKLMMHDEDKARIEAKYKALGAARGPGVEGGGETDAKAAKAHEVDAKAIIGEAHKAQTEWVALRTKAGAEPTKDEKQEHWDELIGQSIAAHQRIQDQLNPKTVSPQEQKKAVVEAGKAMSEKTTQEMERIRNDPQMAAVPHIQAALLARYAEVAKLAREYGRPPRSPLIVKRAEQLKVEIEALQKQVPMPVQPTAPTGQRVYRNGVLVPVSSLTPQDIADLRKKQLAANSMGQ